MLQLNPNIPIPRLTANHVKILKSVCDHTQTIIDGSHTCILGWRDWHDENRDTELMVMASVDGQAELDRMMGRTQPLPGSKESV